MWTHQWAMHNGLLVSCDAVGRRASTGCFVNTTCSTRAKPVATVPSGPATAQLSNSTMSASALLCALVFIPQYLHLWLSLHATHRLSYRNITSRDNSETSCRPSQALRLAPRSSMRTLPEASADDRAVVSGTVGLPSVCLRILDYPVPARLLSNMLPMAHIAM